MKMENNTIKTKLNDNFHLEHKLESISAINFINLNKKQKEIILNMRNNQNIAKWMQTSQTITKKEHEVFVESLRTNYKKAYFAILVNNEIIGMCSFNDIDYINKNSFIGIYAKDSGFGLGSKIMHMIKYIAFIELELHIIYANVLENNKYAIQFYKKHNFEENGRLIERKKIEDKNNKAHFIDILIFSLKDSNVYSS